MNCVINTVINWIIERGPWPFSSPSWSWSYLSPLPLKQIQLYLASKLCSSNWRPTIPICADSPVAFAFYKKYWVICEQSSQYQAGNLMFLSLKSSEWATGKTLLILYACYCIPSIFFSRVQHTVFWKNRVWNKKYNLETLHSHWFTTFPSTKQIISNYPT